MPTQSLIPGLWAPFACAFAALFAFAGGGLWGRRRERARRSGQAAGIERKLQDQARADLENLLEDRSQLESKCRKLQEIRRRNDDIFRHLRQGVVLLDRNLAVEWSNPAARRLTHRTSIQLLGSPFDALEWSSPEGVHSFDAAHPSPWQACMQTGSPVDPVELALSLDGLPVWLEVYCFPAYDPEGKTNQVVVILEDVTRQVGTQREVEHLRKDQGAKPSPARPDTVPSPSSGRPVPAGPASQPPPRALETSAVRVLLVEDNPVNQAVAMGILRKLGLELEMAPDGRQALERLARSPFHLVFMDCQMPVMDGYEATRRIRDPSTDVMDHAVPIVAVTANALKGDREKCLECGMDDYLPKPVTRDGFEQILTRWIPGWSPAAISTLPSELDDAASQAPSVGQREIFDRPALVRRLLGQEELVGTLLDMFFQDGPVQLAELAEALGQGNWPEGQRLAHGIKGTLANLEAKSAAQAASVVEHACRSGNGQVALDGLADLRDEMARAQEAMREALR